MSNLVNGLLCSCHRMLWGANSPANNCDDCKVDKEEKLKMKMDEQFTNTILNNISELLDSLLIKIDGLEQVLSHNYEHSLDGIEKCFERIEELEKKVDVEKLESLIFHGAETHASILKLERKIGELETEINIVRSLGSLDYHPKRPHKCPVCEGSGNHPNQTQRLMCSVHTKTGLYVCISCEGKGILWG